MKDLPKLPKANSATIKFMGNKSTGCQPMVVSTNSTPARITTVGCGEEGNYPGQTAQL